MNRLLLLLSLFLSACAATGNKIDTYDRNPVTRNYTLPEGMKSWSILTRSFSTESDSAFAVNPLYFEHPITDEFTLHWWPLPLGFTWEFLNDPNHKAAFTYDLYIFGYVADLKYKFIINSNLAIEPDIYHEYYDAILFESTTDMFSLNLIYKLNESWAIKPGIGYGSIEGDSDFIDSITSGLTGTDVDSHTEFDILRYGIEMFYTINRQWDMGLSLNIYEIQDYEIDDLVSVGLTFTHYWDKLLPGEERSSDKKQEARDIKKTTP